MIREATKISIILSAKKRLFVARAAPSHVALGSVFNHNPVMRAGSIAMRRCACFGGLNE
jgi:hypothetical protein